jgi:hypothetical protein
MIYSKILDNALKDPVTLKAKKDCINPKCKGKLVKQVRIGDEMLLYNICLKCETKWNN